MGAFSGRTECVLRDSKEYIFQCLVVMLVLNTCSSLSFQPGIASNRLFLEARFDIRGLRTVPLYRLILDQTPLQRKMAEVFNGVSGLRRVEITDIKPRPGQIALNWTLEFTQTVTPGIRRAVALTVLRMEQQGNITVSKTTLPFALHIGIFDQPNRTLGEADAIDWCSSPTLYTCREGGVCSDSGLRYTCPCGEGLADNGTHCFKKWEPEVTVRFNINTNIDFSDNTSQRYTEMQNEISQQMYNILSRDIRGLQAVVVESLRAGSVIAYCRLVLSTTGQSPGVTFTLMNLAGQTVRLNGQNTRMQLQFPTRGQGTPNVCDIHQALYPVPCQDKVCQISRSTGDPSCICLPGFKERSPVDPTCVDVDECNENCDCCDQVCTNTIGSFTCGCNRGFTLDSDGRTCLAITCGATHAAASGAIETPGYSSGQRHRGSNPGCKQKRFSCRRTGSLGRSACISECIWTITTAPGTAIKLTVEDIDTDDYDCCTNHIEIRNGIHRRSERLASLCGTTEPKPFISTSNNLYIQLDSSVRASRYRPGNRFRASWETVCLDQVRIEEQGVIQSPGFPGAYPPNLDCTYVIDPPFGYAVDLTEIRFQLDRNTGDYLEVNGVKYYESNFPNDLSLAAGAVLIRFHSDRSTSSSTAGFSIQFTRHEERGIRGPGRNFCNNWYKKNLALANAYSAGFSRLPHCPCSVSNMRAYGFVYSDGCYHLSKMGGKSVQPFGKRCCYRGSSLESATNLPYNPSFDAYRPKYEQEEKRADRDCSCLNSFNCASYEQYRPNLKNECLKPDSKNTKVPIIDASSWGEPHIITLDKAEYTFNGWGEYTLLQVSSDDMTFSLQGRTAPFQIGPDRYVNATVFTAFGARQGAATVFVELDQDTKTSLVVYGNDRDMTLQFREDPDFTWDTEDYLLQKQNDSLYAAFPSGIGIRVSVRMKTLAISVAMPLTFSNRTQGLLGNFNGNKNDDFVLPNGTVLSSSMTEREIFHKFGKAWAVTERNTVMRYGPREGPADYAHPEFLPVFLDEQPADVIQAAEQQCGANNLACIYDYVATGNRDLALDSRTVKEEADAIAVLENNNAPTVDAPSTLRVTPNVRTYFTIKGNDYDNETLTFNAEDDANGQLRVDPATGNVTFTLTAENPPRLSFYTVDPKGERSVSKDILLLICDCGANGRCSFPNVTAEASEHNYFQNVNCTCNMGWDGAKCDQDKNSCSDAPCLPGQNCTDLSPSEEQRHSVGYDCGPCPQGYSPALPGRTNCLDIDECAADQTNQCSMLCINTAGSYRCGCRSGYQLNNDERTCLDVNECSEKLDGCPQRCRNTVGGFECVCEDGYTYNQANNSCTADPATANLCRNARCSQGCKPVTDAVSGSRTHQCFCLSGYDVDPTNPVNCVDRDECQSNLCSQRCSNNEGSFTCSCHSGYQLNQDQRTCTSCPDQRYGVQCSQTCTCSGRGLGCNHVTGCVCPGGWTGEHCEQDVDECTESPEVCGADKECLNTEGSYTCRCPLGYTLDDSDQCQDFDECAESYHTCGPLENCVNVPGDYNCTCKPGYRRDGDNCVDIDECGQPWSNTCQQECVNVPGSFNCLCSFRYKLASNRLSCVAETDICQLQSGNSLNCQYGCGIADDDSIFCLSPPPGFRYDQTTQRFVDIDECQNSSSCSHTCTNIEGSFNCSCPVGMFLDNDRRTCLTCPTGTYGRACAQQCNCGRGASRCDVIRGCVCRVGWTGDNSDVDRNECADPTVQCQGSASCVNTPGSYRCQCQAGYRNASVGFCQDIDECASSPCEQQCENSPGSYRCLCSRGFTLEQATGTCRDVDECGSDSSNRCTQVCLNNPGSYVCGCNQAGFTLDDDGFTCLGTRQDSFFLITSSQLSSRGNGTIFRMDTETYTTTPVPISAQMSNPVAVDYDPVEQKVYWTDLGRDFITIQSAHLSGSNLQTVFNTSSGAVLDGLAVDSLSRLIFYTDTGNDIIAIVTMSTHAHKIVVNSSLDQPRAIVLDTVNGVMFWSDWGYEPKIERADYDGSNRRELVNSRLSYVNALAIDVTNNRLYWADAGTDLIESSDLQGNGRRTVLPAQTSRHYFGLALFNNALYVTDWGINGGGSRQSFVLRHSLNQTGSLTSLFSSDRRLNDIHAYDGAPAGSNGCGNNNGGCSAICIPLPSNRSKCMCPDCQRLSSNGRTCVPDTGVTCNP